MTDATHKMSALSFTSTMDRLWNECVFEPVPSTRCFSVREMWQRPEYVRHRFPFRGGISQREVMHRMLMDSMLQKKCAYAAFDRQATLW